MSEESPKLFISYSWSSPEHMQWVVDFASQLREDGVDVILDKWDLKEGQDANAFMEQMVSDTNIKKVAIICDREYVEKADKRSGGVGTETQIINPEIYKKSDQTKFVAIIAEKDPEGKPYLPVYYKSRIYIDLSDDDLYSENYEQVLRWVYGTPSHIKPELGKKPAFLSESAIILGTTAKFKRAIDAIRNNKPNCTGNLSEYFEAFTNNLEKFHIGKVEGEFDDALIANIEEFIPFRNEAIEIFTSLAHYRNIAETHDQIHRFFEGLLPYMYKPDHVTSHGTWDFDNFRFIIHELFLYAVAIFLKYDCFDAVAYLLNHRYYWKSIYTGDRMIPFINFHKAVDSLKYRNDRLKLQRVSIGADLLEQRCRMSNIPFSSIMQADFTLYMRGCFEILRYPEEARAWAWWPETIIYSERQYGPFEIFVRAESKEYFNRIKCLFSIEKKEDFEQVFQAYKDKKLHIPQWGFFNFVDPSSLLGYAQMAKRP